MFAAPSDSLNLVRPAMRVAAWVAARLAAVMAASVVVLVTGLAATPALGAEAAPQAPASALRPLHWLAGCWHSEIDEPGSGEQWMADAGGTMLGMARTLKGGRVVQFEFMQIRESAAGVVFVAQPSGQPGTRFGAIELSESAVVFERIGPDFPQRVIYRLQPDGRLAARIEGQRNGEPRGVDFPMRRGACGALPETLPAPKPTG